MSPRHRPLSPIKAIILSASFFAALVGFSQATGNASGPVSLEFDQYIHRSSGPAADPVNLIFYGGGPDDVAAAVHRVLGWAPADGSPMLFIDHEKVRETRWQVGQDLGRGDRWHLRIEDVTPSDGQDYVLAAVHHDSAVACGHVGGEFDEARRRVAKAFKSAGYGVTSISLGNSAPGLQCDGTSSAGDGTVSVIDLATAPGGR